MKKGYVMEVKEEYLLVMSEDRKFLRLQKRRGIDAGEEILFSESQVLDITGTTDRMEAFMKKIKHAKPMGIAAAMVLFLVLSIAALTGGEEEARYLLSFDVNPSVGIEVGENEEVLEVYAANDRAKELALEDLEGESLEVFLDEFLEKLAEKGYLNNDSAQVLLSYADLLEEEEASQDLIDRVTEQMQNYFAEKNLMVDINTLIAEGENYENARLEGITLGKFQLIKEIETEESRAVEGEEGIETEDAASEEGAESEDAGDTEDEEEASGDREEYRNMPVRELLQHPVFERHPRDRKAEGLHPVFDVHPRDWNPEDGDKPHPVFDQHPGNRGNDDQDEDREREEGEHPVFDQHPGDRDKEEGEHPVFDQHPRDRDKEEKEHPVFDEHPGDRDKEEGEHPVFDQHPGDREDSDEQESDDEGSSKDKPEHPIFANHPGNRGNGNSKR